MSESVQSADNGELSLGDVFRAVWAGRGVIVGGLLIGLILGVGAALLNATRVNAVTEYFISLPLITNGQYPNGTEFSPQDLFATEVMSRLATQSGLPDASELRKNLTVEFSTPIATGIIAKYRERLSARNLSGAEINALNTAFQEELESATSSSLRLALNHGALGISANAARDILMRLPTIWSEVYTTQFRVFDDPRLPVSLAELGPPISSTLGLVNADRTLEAVRRGLTILANDNRLLGLETEQGNTAFDVSRRADDLSNLYLGPLLSARRDKGNLVELYIQQYQMAEGELALKLLNVRNTISLIQSIMTRQDFDSPAAGDGDQLQIDGGALATIVSLANQAPLSSYLTRLFDEQKDMVAEQAILRTKVMLMTASTEVNLDQTLINQAETELSFLISEYNQLLAAARAAIRTQGTVLYQPVGSPITIDDNPLRFGLALVAAAVLLALALSLLTIFVLPFRRKRA